MKKAILVLFGLLVFASNSSFASTEDKKDKQTEATAEAISSFSTLTGKVIDKTTGEGLAGVSVKVEGTNIEVFTDFEGNFRLSNLSSDACQVSASYISYEKETIGLNPNAKKELILALKSIK